MLRSEAAALKQVIKKLTKVQREAFDRICVGLDSCIAPATAKALEKRGLINYGLKRDPEYSNFQIWRCDVKSINVHRLWCEVCDEELTNEPRT